jgi:hypothetical protein
LNRLFVSVFALLSLGAASRAALEKTLDPCSLLTKSEIQAVQGHAPAEKVGSEQPAESFRFTQCFYRTPDVTSSVSVAVGVPLATDGKRSGPRDYWKQRFHSQPLASPGRKKKEPPKQIAGLGDEAFWVGDPVTGALYVLKGDVFLRLSVGGARDPAQNMKRARTLALHALKRLQAGDSRPRS